MNVLAPESSRCPPLPPQVGGCVVVAASLAVDAETEAACAALLSPDERVRRLRLVREADRRRFCVARGLLRQCLSIATGLRARDIRFAYGARGRPALAPECADGAPAFNVSHSGDFLLMAFAGATTVGIDLECIRPVRDEEALARRFFAPAEVAELLSRESGHARTRAFLNGWTRKEALIKAEGEGIFSALDRFTVSLADGDAVLYEVAGDPDAVARWRLHAVDGGADWIGTLAVPAGVRAVHAVQLSAPAVLRCAAARSSH